MLPKKEEPAKKQVFLLLFGIVVLGFFLRFYGLTKQSLWHDEFASWSLSNYDNMSEVLVHIRYDLHPPGYQIMLYFVEKYLGDSEWLLRFPSALGGGLAILAMYWLGTRLYSYREGLFAAAFTAVLWSPVYYSQEARAYSLLLLFSVLPACFWISILEGLSDKIRLSPQVIFGYIATAVVCCYLHYFGLYLIFLQGLVTAIYFILKPRKWLHILGIYTAIVAAFLPCFIIMLDKFMHATSWIPAPKDFGSTIIQYFGFLYNNPSGYFPNKNSKEVCLFVVLMYAFLLIYSLYCAVKSRKYKDMFISKGMLLVLWLIVPFITVYIKSRVSTPILTYRNLIISLPAAYLLLSRSIARIPIRFRYHAALLLIISALLVSHLVFCLDFYSMPHKQQFREAVEFIVKQDPSHKNSLIISCGLDKFFDYYFEKFGSDRRVDVIGQKKEDIPEIVKTIRAEKPQYIWYIRAHKIPDRQFLLFLDKNLTCIDYKNFLGADVWLFRLQKTGTPSLKRDS